MDFRSDSDGDDAFGGVVIEQTAHIRHRVNELFGFEPKNKQIEAIRHLLYDKRDQGFYQYGRFQYSASYCTYCLGWSLALHYLVRKPGNQYRTSTSSTLLKVANIVDFD